MRSFQLACSNPRTPAQSLALFFLPCLSFFLIHPQPLSAASDDLIVQEDHNHRRIPTLSGDPSLYEGQGGYESDFFGLDRSIIGRAGNDIEALENNIPGILNIDQGSIQYWTFPRSNVSDEPTLYISLTTCIQPVPPASNGNGAPDQLSLYVSTSSGNQKPDQNHNDYVVVIDEGYGSQNISTKSDVYLAVSAPSNSDYSGIYNYQLTASIDGPFASYNNNVSVKFVDSDTTSALFNITDMNNETFLSPGGPSMVGVYVQNQDDPSITGLRRSVCGLKQNAQTQSYDASWSASGDDLPEQQLLHVKNLNGSSNYIAIATVNSNTTTSSNGTVGGGGIVWKFTSFKTKSDNNCALLYNLDFCSSVAYAAPASPDNMADIPALGQHYDEHARNLYQNFSYSLQQIPCNTTSSAQYSLARNCNDCENAYKLWLCAVTIPRCEDFSNNAPYLQPRAVNTPWTNKTLSDQYNDNFDNFTIFSHWNRTRNYFNSSRNLMIDQDIKPGPYKEVLPCEHLCYGLVQSCPAALSFACPLEGHGLNYTYGKMPNVEQVGQGDVTCNGILFSGAAALRGFGMNLAFFAALVTVFTFLGF